MATLPGSNPETFELFTVFPKLSHSNLYDRETKSLSEPATEKSGEVLIYPNPSNGDFVNINIPGSERFDHIQFDIWTLSGTLMFSEQLNEPQNILKIHRKLNGAFAYRISGDGQVLKSGRIMFIN
jgi:hypothetical protein